MSYKKNMNNIKKGLTGFLKETLDKGKEVAQTAAAGVEQYTTLEGAGKLVKGVIQKGREARDYVNEQGGLAQIAKDAGVNLPSHSPPASCHAFVRPMVHFSHFPYRMGQFAG